MPTLNAVTGALACSFVAGPSDLLFLLHHATRAEAEEAVAIAVYQNLKLAIVVAGAHTHTLEAQEKIAREPCRESNCVAKAGVRPSFERVWSLRVLRNLFRALGEPRDPTLQSSLKVLELDAAPSRPIPEHKLGENVGPNPVDFGPNLSHLGPESQISRSSVRRQRMTCAAHGSNMRPRSANTHNVAPWQRLATA